MPPSYFKLNYKEAIKLICMKVEYYFKKCGLLINNTQTVNYTTTPHFVKLLQDWNKEHSLSEKKINEIQSFSQNKI